MKYNVYIIIALSIALGSLIGCFVSKMDSNNGQFTQYSNSIDSLKKENHNLKARLADCGRQVYAAEGATHKLLETRFYDSRNTHEYDVAKFQYRALYDVRYTYWPDTLLKKEFNQNFYFKYANN